MNPLILVNGQHAYPADTAQDLIPVHANYPDILLEQEAAQALARLMDQLGGWRFMIPVSGWRSLEEQRTIYEHSLRDNGPAFTEQFVARPGHSEHQTGLALDVSCPRNSLELTESFAGTPEGQWLSKNAHLHGFILRYPREKEKITGYAWEPWHIRYVTKSLSLYLALTGLALEEWVTLHSPIRTRTSP